MMTSLVKAGKKNITIRDKAASLVQGLRQKDYVGEIRTLWDFVKNNIRYLRDINEVETLYTPQETLGQEYGDCDDKAVLLASMLEAIGHPTRFVAVGFEPEAYSHVFVDTRVGQGWISLETTENVPFGWRPPGIVSIMVSNNHS